jgi:putative flavoprotein involved in K+ transport
VEVTSLERTRDRGFLAITSEGSIAADQVVVTTGAFQRPHLPASASTMPSRLLTIDLTSYSNPGTLPPGRVLVVGSGQSGCQLAEELHQAGRDVVLSCGRAPWVPRRVADRDVFWWLRASGFLEVPAHSLPPAARLLSNPLTTGHGGGHDLHLRTLRQLGVTLVGRFLGVGGEVARFAPDLGATIAWGDDRHRELIDLIRRTATGLGIPFPELAAPSPFDPPAPETVDLDGFGTVIFTGGFRPDYLRWMPWPEAFDESGYPIQEDGASTVIPGLYFVGVHFLRKRKSSILLGVGEDAAIVGRTIAARLS